MTEVVLWTNPSPTADFGEQTITLSDDIDNFDFIEFAYKPDKSQSDDQIVKELISPTDLKQSVLTDGAPVFAISSQASGYTHARPITYVSNTSLKFGESRTIGAAGRRNFTSFPISISGIKK